MDSNKKLYVKLHFKKTVKRVLKIAETFEEFQKQVLKAFPALKDKTYEITYRDCDEDWIEVADDDDLAAALEFCGEYLNNRDLPSLTFRFFIKVEGDPDCDYPNQPSLVAQSHLGMTVADKGLDLLNESMYSDL